MVLLWRHLRAMGASTRAFACVSAVLLLVSAGAAAQQPVRPLPVPTGPRPNAGPPDRPNVDPAAAARGRALYGVECITCHGASARGTASAPSLIRSGVVLNDRYGTTLGPFFRQGHTLQSGRSSTGLSDADVLDLMHFLRQRIDDTLRGSSVFVPANVVTGHAAAGQAFFTGEGRCASCHSVTGDLSGIGTRLSSPVDVQQRLLFPSPRPATGGQPSRGATTVTITRQSRLPETGGLVQEDDFFVTWRDDAGIVRAVRKGPGVTVVTTDPLQAHHELLDRITDANIHDLVAYLVTLK